MFSRFLDIRQKITPAANKIIGNASWLVVDRLFRMIAGLIVGVWVARYLGPEKFGLLNYAMAFAALFLPLSTLGLEEIVTQGIVTDPDEQDKLLGSSFVLKLIGGVLSLAIATLCISLSRSDSLSWALVSIFAGVYIFQTFDVIIFWFNAQVQSKYAVFARSAAFTITTILKIGLIQTKASLLAFAWISLAEAFLTAIFLILFYRQNQQYFLNWKPRLLYTKQLLRRSYPMIFTAMATILYLKIDQVMLGQILGDEAVGIYSVAVRISEIWYFIPLAIASSVTPSIVHARQTDLSQFYKKLQTVCNGSVLISYLISIGVSFLAQPVILNLYGTAYSDAVPILMVHIWSSTFVFLIVIRGVFLIAEDLTMVYMQTTMLGAIMNIILNLFLIPRYAGFGAAIATVISYAIASYLSCMFYPRLKVIFQIMNRAITLRWLISSTINIKR
jgi:polysaccharide transporter, PST family